MWFAWVGGRPSGRVPSRWRCRGCRSSWRDRPARRPTGAGFRLLPLGGSSEMSCVSPRLPPEGLLLAGSHVLCCNDERFTVVVDGHHEQVTARVCTSVYQCCIVLTGARPIRVFEDGLSDLIQGYAVGADVIG